MTTHESLNFKLKIPSRIKTPEELSAYREDLKQEIRNAAQSENVSLSGVSHTENLGLGEILLVLQIAGAAATLFCDRVVPVIRRKYPNFPNCPKST